MAKYLIQASYEPQSWAAQLKSPSNRVDTLRPVFERLGGKIEQFFYAFGEYDVVSIVDMPDNVSVSAFALAGAAGGALKSIKTTPLLTIEEGLDAMRKASDLGYTPPGK